MSDRQVYGYTQYFFIIIIIILYLLCALFHVSNAALQFIKNSSQRVVWGPPGAPDQGPGSGWKNIQGKKIFNLIVIPSVSNIIPECMTVYVAVDL